MVNSIKGFISFILVCYHLTVVSVLCWCCNVVQSQAHIHPKDITFTFEEELNMIKKAFPMIF